MMQVALTRLKQRTRTVDRNRQRMAEVGDQRPKR